LIQLWGVHGKTKEIGLACIVSNYDDANAYYDFYSCVSVSNIFSIKGLNTS